MTKRYEWQRGDTLSSIALKYRRHTKDAWKELFDHNKLVIIQNRYLMRPGDIIEIPDDWFPLAPIQRERETVFKGTSGYARYF